MDDLRERVEAVERALTDGDGDLTALAEGAARADRVADLEADVEELRDTVAEVEAATQALRGYVGNVRSVNESVEQRADAAVAAVESLEEQVASRTDEPARAGTASGADGHATDHDHHGPGTDGGESVCRACGRSTRQATTAADGGSPNRPTADNRGDEPGVSPPTPTGADAQPGGRVERQSLDGFDPADESHRVRIGPDGRNTAGEQRGRPAGTPTDAQTTADGGARSRGSTGFLARVRELL